MKTVITFFLSFLFFLSCSEVKEKQVRLEGIEAKKEEISRVEPPFWWAGMKNKDLQLLIEGDNINSFEINIHGLSKGNYTLEKLENSNFTLLNLSLESVEAKTLQLQFSKKNKVLFTKDYEIKNRRENSAEREGFSNSDVIYLVMPDRFSNGDTSNDSHVDAIEKHNREFKGGRHGGDIQGIRNHIDYINDLGVTALWSTPMLFDNDTIY